MSAQGLELARAKMAEGGVHQRAIDVFAYYYEQIEGGATGMLPESEVQPLVDPPRLAGFDVDDQQARAALTETAVIKLNGGLGTSMGMDRAKSLLPVRGDLTFLDVIVEQVRSLRSTYGARLPLVFMDSFRTRDDTLVALAKSDGVAVDGLPMDFLQNREPKLRADDLTPVSWPADPELEWCPPGHGDLYTALEVSGLLESLLQQGFRYATVSNSDNLGAAPNPTMAGWFAASGAPYAAEVCRRTPADRKGGHLVVRDGRLVLRETAQTPAADAEAASDIERHRYFHTNNLWFDLRALAETLERNDGVLGLPLIRNEKTVDPTDPASPKVIQIETAMGAAVQVFDGAVAVEVPRSRFLPVKTTNDLLLLRSDAYGMDNRGQVALRIERAPLIDLDPAYYKTIADFDARFPSGPPSLAHAESLTVRGDWTFAPDVEVRGAATLDDTGTPSNVDAGTELG